MPTAACAASEESRTTLSLAADRQQLLHQKERRADIDGEQRVEILDRGVLDGGGFGDAGIGDKNVEPVAHDVRTCSASLCGPSGAARSAADGLSAAAGLADLGDDGVGLDAPRP